MLSLSIDEAISALEGLGQKIADEAESIMRQEAPVRSGALVRSIHQSQEGDSTWFIGTSIEYAKYVNDGRGDVYPVRAKALHWVEFGRDIFTRHAGPAAPNDFVGRTAARLRGMSFTL